MQLPFQTHWLEQAIGGEREAVKIAQKIADHLEFRKMIQEAINSAPRECAEQSKEARFIAEHIAFRLHNSFGGFTTTHRL